MYNLTEYQTQIHKTAVEKGFWKHSPNFAEKIALAHSELSACWEELRYKKNNTDYDIVRELIDCVIHILDMCEGFSISLNHTEINRRPSSIHDFKRMMLDVNYFLSGALEENRISASPSLQLSKALQYLLYYIDTQTKFSALKILEEVLSTNKNRKLF